MIRPPKKGIRLWVSRPGRTLRLGWSHLRHPRKITCLDCGFLALGDSEVTPANRILLEGRGVAGSPPLEDVRCSHALWVSYDLNYTMALPRFSGHLKKPA